MVVSIASRVKHLQYVPFDVSGSITSGKIGKGLAISRRISSRNIEKSAKSCRQFSWIARGCSRRTKLRKAFPDYVTICYYVEAEATCRVGWSSTHLVVLHGSFDYPIYVDAKSLSRLEMHMKCISISDTWPLTATECTLWALFVQQQSLWMRLKPTSPKFLFIYLILYIYILGHIRVNRRAFDSPQREMEN